MNRGPDRSRQKEGVQMKKTSGAWRRGVSSGPADPDSLLAQGPRRAVLGSPYPVPLFPAPVTAPPCGLSGPPMVRMVPPCKPRQHALPRGHGHAVARPSGKRGRGRKSFLFHIFVRPPGPLPPAACPARAPCARRPFAPSSGTCQGSLRRDAQDGWRRKGTAGLFRLCRQRGGLERRAIRERK